VPESALPAESDLHDALTDFPALIPAEDLDLAELVVVGRESGLVSGFADLVLIDRHGHVCLVEVKKNSEARRVVAQLLEYAAALWGMDIGEFERQVAQPYLAATETAPTLAEHLAGAFGLTGPGEHAGDELSVLTAGLERTLAEGDLHLVVAAPNIPLSVQRVLEYLNARGQRMYGLEVSYFGTDAPCFVPRLVVRPSLARAPVGGERGAPAMDLDALLAGAPESAATPLREFLERAGQLGAGVEWKGYGASVRVRHGGQTRVVCQLEAARIYVTIKASGGFPESPFARAAEQLQALGVGTVSKDSWYRIVGWAGLDPKHIWDVLAVALELIEALTPTVHYEELPEPLIVSFTRDDYCVWAKGVAPLAGEQGRAMRGRLRRDDGTEADVVLEPMAGGQPGWRPHFPGVGDQQRLWPTGEHGGHFEVTVTALEAGKSDTESQPEG